MLLGGQSIYLPTRVTQDAVWLSKVSLMFLSPYGEYPAP